MSNLTLCAAAYTIMACWNCVKRRRRKNGGNHGRKFSLFDPVVKLGEKQQRLGLMEISLD